MGFPDRIERTVEVARPPAKVWAALTSWEWIVLAPSSVPGLTPPM